LIILLEYRSFIVRISFYELLHFVGLTIQCYLESYHISAC